jgi:periplasmic protein TonB
MRILLTLVCLLFITTGLKAQTLKDSTSGQEVYLIVEHQPEPAGGMEGLVKHIRSEMKYPKDARRKNKQGKVFVEFVIDTDGSIDQNSVTVLSSVYKSLDEEAMRVVRNMPKWTPGISDGIPVRVRMVIPLVFAM